MVTLTTYSNTFMKKLFTSISLIFSISILQSQISILRYNDNFSTLKNGTHKKGFDKLKYIKIADHSFISFGGELREQFQYFDNLNFGDGSPGSKQTDVGQLWQRIMAHSNIEVGAKTRIFLQLNSTFRFFNPNPLAPEVDENQLSLHQAFIDYQILKKWMLRVGRQEMDYGNNRLLSFREGPNTRLTFDGAMINYSSEKSKIDFFAVTPVISRQYVFDDRSFNDAVLGVYATTYIAEKLLLDYYFINFKSDRRRYNFIAGEEHRQTFGLRFFSKNPKLNYEMETTYQMGTFRDLTVSAYALSADINSALSENRNFVIGLAANYITGDKDRNDGKLNTYNFLFSKPQFGLAASVGASNIENINPYVKISLAEKLAVFTAVYFMRRKSTEDGTYSPGADQVRPNPSNLYASEAREIGSQYAIETNYSVDKNISFAVDAALFKAGNYVKQTGSGKDITYLTFKFTCKF